MMYNIDMSELTDALKVTLADTVTLKYKAQGYHWNVEGDDFPQYHDFYGTIYEDFDGAVDTLAELIRRLGEYAPFKLTRFSELTQVQDTDVTSDPEIMSADLYKWIIASIEQIRDTFDIATAAREHGVANFLADRLDAEEKWAWQLSAVLKPEPDEAPEVESE